MDSSSAEHRSSLISRNVTIKNHRTSVRLEPDMWVGLREICRRERSSMHDICSTIAANKAPNTSLTAAIRVFIMSYFRAAATEDGHNNAGHGPGGSFMAVYGHSPTSSSARPQFRSGRETSSVLLR
jgi:predicted DNA-binding ribbon-helix-helix protein